MGPQIVDGAAGPEGQGEDPDQPLPVTDRVL